MTGRVCFRRYGEDLGGGIARGDMITMMKRIVAGGVLVGVLISGSGLTARADSWTGPDKVKHMVVSCVLTVAAAAFFDRQTTWSTGRVNAAAAGLALCVGMGKEWYDSASGGSWSWPDMAANAAGAGMGITARICF